MIEGAPRTLATGLGFPEGPVHTGQDELLFTQIRGACVSRYAGGNVELVARTGGGANSCARAADGTVFVANNGGLSVGPDGYWFAPDFAPGRVQVVRDGDARDLYTAFPGEPPARPNDLVFGPDGHLYVTDPANWEDLANLRPGRVWRAHRDGSRIEIVAEVPNFPNGIAFGADGATLFVAQSMGMAILALPWSAGGIGDAVVLCTLERGFPDGLCVSAGGDILVCGSMGDVICVFDAEGAPKQTVEMPPGTEPTNCCLGDGLLYVTLSGTGELVAFETDAEPARVFD